MLSFQTGEPETVAWIRQLPPDVFWDVGANIGLYSMFAAMRGHQVLAFEPSAASFAALCKNIEINEFSGRISAFCVALGEQTALGTLWMTDSGAGHSRHSVGERGDRRHRQAIPVFSSRDFVDSLGAVAPAYVKLDVDGLEPDILRGMGDLLRGVKAVLVEAETENAKTEITSVLSPFGLLIDPELSASSSRNIIYKRN